jgi:hypothetical protein
MIYLIGSLRNPEVPTIANRLREAGHEVFDDWYSAGFEADDHLWAYEKGRGHNAVQALQGHAAKHIFMFDKKFLDLADAAVLLMPAGKSAFFELGVVVGSGRPGYILLDKDPERIDIMFQFATGIFYKVEDLISELA